MTKFLFTLNHYALLAILILCIKFLCAIKNNLFINQLTIIDGVSLSNIKKIEFYNDLFINVAPLFYLIQEKYFNYLILQYIVLFISVLCFTRILVSRSKQIYYLNIKFNLMFDI